MNFKFSILLLFLGFKICFSQGGFQIEGNKDKVVFSFQLINNLIVIPILVNNVPLNFLLDSGVEETIILSLEDKNEININNVEKIKIKGLGSNESVEGLLSIGNSLKIKELTDNNHKLYIILDQDFNFSTHLGVPINGIIGYHFFKNHLVEINYDKRKIIVYKDSSKISKKRISKFQSIPIEIEKQKPYCQVKVTLNKQTIDAKVLIDIGNSDALWLFQDTNTFFKVPEPNFEDYLGKGFSGEIHGKRTRINSFSMGKFTLNNPIIAMPDTISVKSVTMVKNRVGSIGGDIIKRFVSIIDYPNYQVFLKKGKFYNNDFQYNRSGIEIVNSGLQWVPETMLLHTTTQSYTFDSAGERVNEAKFKYKFILKPIYLIENIRYNSPAIEAGLQKGDCIVSINNTSVNNLSLNEINNLLKSQEGKWLQFEISREGKILEFKFQIKELL